MTMPRQRPAPGQTRIDSGIVDHVVRHVETDSSRVKTDTRKEGEGRDGDETVLDPRGDGQRDASIGGRQLPISVGRHQDLMDSLTAWCWRRERVTSQALLEDEERARLHCELPADSRKEGVCPDEGDWDAFVLGPTRYFVQKADGHGEKVGDVGVPPQGVAVRWDDFQKAAAESDCARQPGACLSEHHGCTFLRTYTKGKSPAPKGGLKVDFGFCKDHEVIGVKLTRETEI